MKLADLIERLQHKQSQLGNIEVLMVDANGAWPIVDVYDAEDESDDQRRRYVAITNTEE
jgi:hypothetical protein